ncbi:MAG: hypothetical protein ACLRS8_18150 [Parabacteroides merdae]
MILISAPCCFFRSSVLKQAVRAMDADYRFAGLYDLRLRVVSELAELVRYRIFVLEVDDNPARAERSCLIMLIRKTGRCRSSWKLFVRPT